MNKKTSPRKDKHRINEQVRHREVRIVGFGDDSIDGVRSSSDALKIAEERGLDLIEINATANPPVCKIADYSKFKYEQKKRDKELKKNQPKTQLKEIKFGPNTGDHDLEFKSRNAEKFLSQGHKVKAYVQFRGREHAHRERGELMLLRFAEKLSENGTVESMPQMQGRNMVMFLSPKK